MGVSQYNSVAQEYEEIRPGYTNEIFDTLILKTGIDSMSSLLEIGAGTGKATEILAQKGFNIDCIEIEPEMAAILMEKCKDYNVSIQVENFEKWDAPSDKMYNLIFSAQAFHWIDESIKYKKCNRLLNPSGHLGLMWYFAVIDSQEIYKAVNTIFKKYNTGYSCFNIDDYNRFSKKEEQQLAETTFFKNVVKHQFNGAKIEQDADLFIKRFNTTSAFVSLDEHVKGNINSDLKDAINSNGGKVSSELVYVLFIAEKA